MEINPYQTPVVSGPEPFVLRSSPGRGVFAALSEGVRLYLQHWPLYVAVMVIVQTPLCLWGSYFDYFVYDPDDLRSSFRLQQFQEFFFGIIAFVATLQIAIQAEQSKRPSLWLAFGKGIALWPRFLLLGFLLRLALFVGILALIIPALYLLVVLSLSYVAAVVENRSAFDSLRRSRELAAGHFWTICGVNTLAVLAVLVFAIGLHLPGAFIMEEVPWWVDALVTVVGTLALPYSHLCSLAMYRQLTSESRPPAFDSAT